MLKISFILFFLVFISTAEVNTQEISVPDTILIDKPEFVSDSNTHFTPELYRIGFNSEDGIQIEEMVIENIDREENGDTFISLYYPIYRHINGNDVNFKDDELYFRVTFRANQPEKSKYEADISIKYRIIKTDEIKYDTINVIVLNPKLVDTRVYSIVANMNHCNANELGFYKVESTLYSSKENLIINDIIVPEGYGSCENIKIRLEDEFGSKVMSTSDLPIDINKGKLRYSCNLIPDSQPIKSIDIPVTFVTNDGNYTDTVKYRLGNSPILDIDFDKSISYVQTKMGETGYNEYLKFEFCSEDTFKLRDWYFSDDWEPGTIEFTPNHDNDFLFIGKFKYFAGEIKFTPQISGLIKGYFTLEFENLNNGETLKIPTFFRTFTDPITNVESNSNLENNLIYPNPVTDILNISNDVIAKGLEVFDLNGRSLQKIEKDINKVDVSHLNRGVYFVKIVTINNIYYKKFIIE